MATQILQHSTHATNNSCPLLWVRGWGIFDFDRECDLIRQHGESYKPFFVAQAHYYAREAHFRVHIDTYEHEIIRDTHTQRVRLYYGPMRQSALDSYARPVMDTARPAWLRRRDLADLRWLLAIQRRLATLEPTGILIDASPAPFDVPLEERRRWGFGTQSFLRLHRLKGAGGTALISHAIRHELDPASQAALFARLTGVTFDLHDLPGRVERLLPEFSVEDVRRHIAELHGPAQPERGAAPSQPGTLDEDAITARLNAPDAQRLLEDAFAQALAGQTGAQESFIAWHNEIMNVEL